jgi:hypothetical protein
MNLLDTRRLYGCGPNAEARIYAPEQLEEGMFMVSIVNDYGEVYADVGTDEAAALAAWLHPFAQDRGLEIPQARDDDKPWTPEEQRIYLGIEVAVAGDSDTIETEEQS